ncbi:MAG TPA: hypothetical protein VJ577_09890 [Burkholderiaceae bacterium]|nr:hypothetical protein [Burkholderiaceae bacterium]
MRHSFRLQQERHPGFKRDVEGGRRRGRHSVIARSGTSLRGQRMKDGLENKSGHGGFSLENARRNRLTLAVGEEESLRVLKRVCEWRFLPHRAGRKMKCSLITIGLGRLILR